MGVEPQPEGLSFYDALPVEPDFARLGSAALYRPVPDDWVVGLADIRGSTAAISKGQYKAVNTVAASVIAAVSNALKGREFPFVFGGDGATFVLPPALAETGRQALQAVARWAGEAFGFDLRIAMVPVANLRAEGHDVRLARFGASPDVAYAMFAGGGVAHAEARMKAGDYALAPAPADLPGPDLTGLSCRFSPLTAQNGLILSLIVLPREGSDPARFAVLLSRLLALVDAERGAGHPVPEAGPAQRWPPAGFAIEARAVAARSGRPLWLSRLFVGLRTLLAHLIFRSGIRVGGFEPARYRSQLVRNTDFRKFDDGLRLTLDCSADVAARIAGLIEEGERDGIVDAGLHRQEAALITCFVPRPSGSDHVHFVDGAMGGYAVAAQAAFRARKISRSPGVGAANAAGA